MSRTTRSLTALILSAAGLLAGCSRHPSEPAPSGSAAPSPATLTSSTAPSAASVPHINPIPEATMLRAINPKALPPYSGPTGTVRGVIRITGDAAPELPEVAASIKDDCEKARSMYGRLFREGAGRTLADVFVGVTGYPHFVPHRERYVTVTARDCAFSSRTLAATFGQGVQIKARGVQSYVPALVGGLEGAHMLAVPNGAPVTLSPVKPGRFAVVDMMRPYVQADLFVVQFSTFDVTDLDGRYEIQGVPAGEVTVSALLPAAGVGAEKKVTVAPDRPAEVDLILTFDKKAYTAKRPAASATPPSTSSAAPQRPSTTP